MPLWFYAGVVVVVALAIFEYFGLKKMKQRSDVCIAELQKAAAKCAEETEGHYLRVDELYAEHYPILQQKLAVKGAE